jgi:adenine phosphoribosyltransferase
MDLNQLIAAVPNFPKDGILFRDITPLLANPQALSLCIEQLKELTQDWQATAIVGAESRGFIFGVLLAQSLGIKFIPARKPGKLPRATYSASYSLEYGKDTMEIHQADLIAQDRVLLVDDLLATGGTAKACIQLIQATSAQIIGAAFVIELQGLGGDKALGDIPYISLLKYQED